MIAYYLFEKCKQKLKENVGLVWKKLSDPASMIDFQASGALADAASGGLSGLAAFAEDYLRNNSDALLMSALEATGLEKDFMQAYNLAMNLMALALMANNNLVLKMMQELAFTGMKELKKKDDILIDLADKTKELYVVLASLVQTSNLWDTYYKNLRDALGLVAQVRADVKMVASTFSATDYWLAKKFDGTVVKLERARDLITPKKNNPAIAKISQGSYKITQSFRQSAPDKTKPKGAVASQTVARSKMLNEGFQQMGKGLQYFGAGLGDNMPFPTTEQQWQATVAIGKISKQLFDLMNGYSEATVKCNALISAFQSGLDSIITLMPAFLKKFVLSLLTKTYDRTDVLTKGMAFALNGADEALSGPIRGFKPNAMIVSGKSFLWIMEINLILQGYKMIPSKQLGALALDRDAVGVYRSCVQQLAAMGDIKSGLAILKMNKAEEELFSLETQMTAFLLEANNAIISSSVRKEILTIGRTILSRLELSLYADNKIYALMELFYYTNINKQDELNKTFDGITKMLGNGGLDRAMGCLVTGDYAKLFNMDARTASYVGNALVVLAMLKKCFKSKAEKDKADDISADLSGDMDLLNISFSINFDLAIFKNLADCLQLNGLAGMFSIQELMCGIAQDIANGNVANTSATFKKLGDLFQSS